MTTATAKPERMRCVEYYVSQREVTHNHQRATFAALVEDIHGHFHTLRQHPDLVLRQLGSPFAPQESGTQTLTNAV